MCIYKRRPIGTTLLLFTLLSSSPNIGSATTIVALRSPNEIVVAADSKGRRDGDKPYGPPLCKIGKVNNLFFAVAGLTLERATNFDAHAIAIQSLQSDGTIGDKTNKFEQVIISPLTRALERIKQDYPLDYERVFVGNSAMQIIFFGFEENLSVLLAREFQWKMSDSGELSVKTTKRLNCPGNSCGAGDTWAFYLGQKEAIEKFRRENPDSYSVGLVPAVRHLVQLEIDNVPDKVGPPIDILSVTKNGAEWIQAKKDCLELK